MPASNQKLYQYHVKNNHSVEIALKNASLAARKAIAEENVPGTKSFVSLYAFLLGAWAENRLKKLLYESPGLTANERNLVSVKSSQFEKWEKLIEVVFRKHYQVPAAALDDSSLPFTAAARYKALNEILNQDLKSVIEIRNRLAHGQWVYPLNSDENDIEQGKYQALNQENIAALQYKKSMITSLADIAHDLVVSLPTFERDFDKHFKQTSNTRKNLKNRSYQKYAENLIEKRKRGIQKRKAHNQSISTDTEKPRSFFARLFRIEA